MPPITTKVESDEDPLSIEDLVDAWPVLDAPERAEAFRLLEAHEREKYFLRLPTLDQADLLLALPSTERRLWLRMLAPDDAADLIQRVPRAARADFLALIDDPTRNEIKALMAYAEDVAGGLMNPRFARVRPDMNAQEALAYLKRQAQTHPEICSRAYVIDVSERLLGLVSLPYLFAAAADKMVADLMQKNIVSVREHEDQEIVSHVMAAHDLTSVPVVDDDGRIKGVIAVDDIVDVVREEATEDMQKIGGMEALNEPYWKITFWNMFRKRGGWLTILFLGELLTATAMGFYQVELAHAVILAMFLPLIISSGGNSGSQATSLVIRAMALGEFRLRDWWRVLSRELASGLALGLLLGSIGFVRILLWQHFFHTYGEHFILIAVTIAFSLVGVVLWGTISGAMLPFALRSFGFDPAHASAPLVATLVDVTGLVIYFSVASFVLTGTLL